MTSAILFPHRRKRPTDILIVGVGGQGVLLASEVVAEAAVLEGLEAKKSEVHGMAQRGGSVVSHLRFGSVVHSPLISQGKADFLVSFEKLETLRYLEYLNRGTRVLVNGQEILPLPVSTGRARYPRNIGGVLKRAGFRATVIDGVGIAERAGNVRAVNSVLLGVLSRYLSFDRATWATALERHVPARHLDVNLKAFERGRRRKAAL